MVNLTKKEANALLAYMDSIEDERLFHRKFNPKTLERAGSALGKLNKNRG